MTEASPFNCGRVEVPVRPAYACAHSHRMEPLMKALRWLLLMLFLATVAGLVTGATWLVRPTPGWAGMPLGNLAIWVTYVLLGVVLLDQARRVRRPGLARLSFGLLLASIAWAPIGYLASGNWGFNFTGSDAGYRGWWMFNGLLAGALLASLGASFLLPPRTGSASRGD